MKICILKTIKICEKYDKRNCYLQKADESKAVKKLWLEDFLRKTKCGTLESSKTNCFLEILLRDDTENEIIGINYVYPSPLKSVSLPVAEIKVRIFN